MAQQGVDDQKKPGVNEIVYDTRPIILREDIMAKANEIASLLAESEEVQMYQKAERMIDSNERIQTLISQIKKKQKEVVGFEHFRNKDMVTKIEDEMKQLQDELDGIPLVQQFQQSQSDINYLLQLVVSVMKDKLSETIQVESGTDMPPASCSD